jgi:hypothetical protein
MSKEAPTGKKKLTLSVDEKVVEKAKSLGLNLSEITEDVLRGFAFAPDETEKEALYAKYEELFASMLPLLKEYDASVKIATEALTDRDGNYIQDVDILLTPDGTFWESEFEVSLDNIRKISTYNLLEPKNILSNFITALADSKQERGERLEELEMVKRIISAITDLPKKSNVQTKHNG